MNQQDLTKIFEAILDDVFQPWEPTTTCLDIAISLNVSRKTILEAMNAAYHLDREWINSLKEKHQEELGNYNSYAASDMKMRHDKAMGDLVMKIEDERNLAADFMGESAAPVITAYNSVLSKIAMINLDNY